MKSSEIKLHGEYAVKDGYLYKRAIVVGTERYARTHLGRFAESTEGQYIPVDLFNHDGDAKPTRRYFRPNTFATTWVDFTASEERQHAEAEARRRAADERRCSEGERLEAVRAALRAVGIEHSAAHAFEPQVTLTLEQAEALVRKLGVTRSS